MIEYVGWGLAALVALGAMIYLMFPPRAWAVTWSDPLGVSVTSFGSPLGGPPGVTVSAATVTPGGYTVTLDRVLYSCDRYGADGSNDASNTYGLDVNPTIECTPWEPTGPWAFIGQVELQTSFDPDVPGQVVPTDAKLVPTGDSEPGESLWTFGIDSEPYCGAFGVGGWQQRKWYPEPYTGWNPPTGDTSEKVATIYAAGASNGDGTWWWKATELWASSSAAGSQCLRTLDVTSSPSPPTISFGVTSALQQYSFDIYGPLYGPDPSDFRTTAPRHKCMVNMATWFGGTENPTQAAAFALVVPGLAGSFDTSTSVGTTSTPGSSGFFGGFGDYFAWVGTTFSYLTTQVAGLTGGMPSWFWPINIVGRW